MMTDLRLISFLFILLGIQFEVNGQNLVPNPSFEEFEALRCNETENYLEFNQTTKLWYSPIGTTPEIISSLVDMQCRTHSESSSDQSFGSQIPYSGDCFAGITTYTGGSELTIGGNTGNWREYIQIELSSPLLPGIPYKGELFVSLADNAQYSSNNMGMFFSKDPFNLTRFYFSLDTIPQINFDNIIRETENWVQLNDGIIPKDTLKYLTIGNFYSDEKSKKSSNSNSSSFPYAYYFIDDVSVRETNCLEMVSRDTTICSGSELELKTESCFFTGWARKNTPNTIFSRNQNTMVNPNSSTTYLAYYDCDTIEINVDIIDLDLNLGPDIEVCQGNSVELTSNITNGSFLWNNGTIDPSLKPNNSGLYTLEVKTQFCILNDSVNVQFTESPVFNLGEDISACEGDSISLNNPKSELQAAWNNGSNENSLTIKDSGEYWLELSNLGCSHRDSINVQIFPVPLVELGNDTILCSGEQIILEGNPSADNTWSIGSNDIDLVITESANLKLKVELNGCENKDEIIVEFISPPSLQLDNEIIICDTDTLILDVTNPYSTYLWNDGSVEALKSITTENSFEVTVQNQCGTETDNINVIEENCNCFIFTPNVLERSDKINSSFKIESNCEFNSFQLNVFDRWGNTLFSSTNSQTPWNGKINGNSLNNTVVYYSFIGEYKNGKVIKKKGDITVLE